MTFTSRLHNAESIRLARLKQTGGGRSRALQAASAALSAALVVPTSHAGNATKGQALYATCVSCHGAKAEGSQTNQAPRLAGRETWYLKIQLQKFKERQRGYEEKKDSGFLENDTYSKLMHPVSRNLTRSDMDHLVAYIETLNPPKRFAPVNGDVRRGQELYASCRDCHGAHAEGSWRKRAPRLTEQDGWYLLEQLKDFRMGWRGTDPKDDRGNHMRAMTDLDDPSTKNLVAYILSLNQDQPGQVRPSAGRGPASEIHRE